MTSSNGMKPVTPESIYFNPFATETRGTTALDLSYGSERNLRPAVRRRGSGTDSVATAEGSSGPINGFRHTRLRTEGTSSTAVVAGGHHPLGSADLSSGFRAGVDVTRPQLTRVLNIPPLVDAPLIPGADMIVAEPAVDERIVLVHEVTSKDSLAGVALKYGINLAELRRANQLWTSDSIHLRKVLYIPIDKTSRPKELLPRDDNVSSPASSPPSTIRRIPASQLSFFPPSQRSDPPSSPTPRSRPVHSHHARYATTPGAAPAVSTSPSFSSILAARDTIIARLSYDSTRTSNSSYSDHDEGHELNDVRFSLDSALRPLARNSVTHTRASSAGGNTSYPRSGPPRTVQLEPSPAMQLPSFATFGRSSKRHATPVYEGFDLLGLRSGEGEGETVDLDDS